MKIFIIGDPHFKSKNALETNEMTNRIYEEVIKEKPDFIVVLGDVLDTHETIHVGPLCRATDFLFKLSSMSNHLYVLVGNHDRPNNSVYLTTDSPFNACKSWKNTTIVDKVVKSKYKNKNFLFVPYVPTGRLAEALLTEYIDKNNINDYSIVFAHQEFKGCNMGVITSNEGDIWDKTFPLCISGHIHDYQVLQPNLIYPGTPIQHGYGDSPNKAVMIVEDYQEDPDEIILEDDENPSDFKFTTRRINLGLPKKITVQISSEELIDYIVPENSFVKLIVKGETDKVKEVMKLEKVKELLKNERIKLSIQEYKKKKDDLNIETSILSEVMSTKFVSFQERLQKILDGEKDEVKACFSKVFGNFVGIA